MSGPQAPPPRRSLARTATVVIPLAVIAALVAAAVTRPPSDSTPGVDVFPVAARQAAPTEPQPLLVGGDELSLQALHGQVVVLNFWASWCGPCRREQPELNRAHRRLSSDGVTFLGVDVQDSQANGRAHWREFDVPYDSVVDPSSEFSARFGGVGPAALPTTIVLDREGRVAVRVFGETTAAQVTALAEQLLAEGREAAAR